MSVIENFAALSEKEQRDFAEALVKTINSESIFSSDVNFIITKVEADDTSGVLFIDVDTSELVEVERPATWAASDSESAYDNPGYDADFENSIFTDAKAAFKTTSADIDNYTVTLDIADVDEAETIDVQVDSMRDEDSGIGHYEYWGHVGYDSHPYVEVEGTIIKGCDCAVYFEVEPKAAPTEPDVDTDEI